MKKVLMVAFMISQSVFAATSKEVANSNECYTALNPKGIIVSVTTENPTTGESEIVKTELGKKAIIKLLTDNRFYDENGTFPLVKIQVQTPSLKAETTATDFQRNGVYGIECDGGNVTLRKSGNDLIASSDYLRAESGSNTSDDCGGEFTFEIKDVVFKKVSCH